MRRKPTFSHSAPATTIDAVDAVAQRLGVTFPADYRQFLLEVNGGCPDQQCFSVPARDDALLDFLYGISNVRDAGDLEYAQASASFHDPLPPGMIAIGHDPGGSILLLNTSADSGEVYYWDREGTSVRDDGCNTFFVAPSFTGLQSLLRPL